MEEFLTSAHAIEERIRAKHPANTLYYDKESEKNAPLLRLAKLFGIPSKEVSREELKSYGAFHVALSIPQESLKGGTQWLKQQIKTLRALPKASILLLDSITDVHNIGAILRSSALFGVDLVIYPERRSASGDHDIVSRVSAGGSEVVNHGAIVNLNYAIDLLKENGFWVYGADMQGSNIRQLGASQGKIARHFGLVLGAEGKGISQKVKENCDEILTIPTNQRLNSLNVSVAAGILLYTLLGDRLPTNTKIKRQEMPHTQQEEHAEPHYPRQREESSSNDNPYKKDHSRDSNFRPNRDDNPYKKERSRDSNFRPNRDDNPYKKERSRDSNFRPNRDDNPYKKERSRDSNFRPNRDDNPYKKERSRDSNFRPNRDDNPYKKERSRDSNFRPNRDDNPYKKERSRDSNFRPNRDDNPYKKERSRDSNFRPNRDDNPYKKERSRDSNFRPNRDDNPYKKERSRDSNFRPNRDDNPYKKERSRDSNFRPNRDDNPYNKERSRDSNFRPNRDDNPYKKERSRDSNFRPNRDDNPYKKERNNREEAQRPPRSINKEERRKPYDQPAFNQRKPRGDQRKRQK